MIPETQPTWRCCLSMTTVLSLFYLEIRLLPPNTLCDSFVGSSGCKFMSPPLMIGT